MGIVNSVYLILWIGWTIGLLVFYHKFFTVYYFGLGSGIMKEFVTAGFLGLIMTGLTLSLWWLVAIVVILVGLFLSKKSGNNNLLIASVVITILLAVAGISVKTEPETSADVSLHRVESENTEYTV